MIYEFFQCIALFQITPSGRRRRIGYTRRQPQPDPVPPEPPIVIDDVQAVDDVQTADDVQNAVDVQTGTADDNLTSDVQVVFMIYLYSNTHIDCTFGFPNFGFRLC